MRAFVAVTDFDWYRYLSAQPDLDEVNFWQPSGGRAFRALEPGELFLFKLHSPRNFIMGGGFFAYWTALPVGIVWSTFRVKNGAASLREMRERIERYRRKPPDRHEDYTIGCILLQEPFFLEPNAWIPVLGDWQANIVQGKTYDLTSGEGLRLWQSLQFRLRAQSTTWIPLAEQTRYGKPKLELPRLGQGSFRVLVTNAYARRCAVTGERALPALEASHIWPFAMGGLNQPSNGLLLRADLHRLFDSGHVTVTPDRRFEVSRRIKDDFDNGEIYYPLQGQPIAVPQRTDFAPDPAYLDWHNQNVFRG